MSESDEKLLRAMIEQSGEMWKAVRDRTNSNSLAIVICQSPRRAFYLRWTQDYTGSLPQIDGWVIDERPLDSVDSAGFLAAFGSYWPYYLGAIIRDAPFRAFIKNGRKEGWSISLDVKAVAEDGNFGNVNISIPSVRIS